MAIGSKKEPSFREIFHDFFLDVAVFHWWRLVFRINAQELFLVYSHKAESLQNPSFTKSLSPLKILPSVRTVSFWHSNFM